MKKKLCLMMAVMLGTAVVSGCGAKAEETPQSSVEEVQEEQTASGDAVLTMGVHQAAVPVSGILQEILADFEKESGIKVDLQIAPDGQWKDMLNVKLGANEAPDIFCTDTTPMSIKSVVNPEENCIDLSQEEFATRMTPEAKACFTYDNKLYGTSLFGNKMWLYFYNKQIFNDLGLEAPKNYEEFKSVCQKIKDSGVTPVFEATPSTWHQTLPLFEVAGSYMKDDEDLYGKLNRNEIKIEEIEGINRVVNQLNEFAQLGFFGEDYLSNNVEEDMNYFAEGKVAMVLNTQGWGEMIQEQFPETKGQIGFFVMPWNDNQVLGVTPSGGGLFGYKKSPRQEEIKEFFRYITREDVLKKYHEGNPNSMEMPFEGIDTKYPAEYNEYFESLEKCLVMQTSVTYIDPNWGAIGKDIEAMYTGVITPEDVVKGIDKKRLDSALLQEDPAFKAE